MAASLVSVVMQFLTPDLIAKIASGLGLDRSVAQKAIGGAVPTLLSSLADVVTNPNGARQLTNIVTSSNRARSILSKALSGVRTRTGWRRPDRARCRVCLGARRWTRWRNPSASSPKSTRVPSSRYLVCLARWSWEPWVNSSAVRAWMQAGWRPFSHRKRGKSPRPFRPAWPIS